MLLVLLRGANEGHVVAFFKEHLGYILGLVSQPVDKGTALLDDLYMKANCHCFMQAYFNLISRDEKGRNKEADNVWINCKENQGHTTVRKEILNLLFILHDGMKLDVARLAPDRREAIFTLHRETVNTFGTWVMRAKQPVKVYDAVFRMQGSDRIWDVLVDPEAPIHLEMLSAEPIVWKKLDAFFNRKGKSQENPNSRYAESMDVMGSRYEAALGGGRTYRDREYSLLVI